MKKIISIMVLLIALNSYSQDTLSDMPKPLKDSVVGEWARYSQPAGNEILYTVTAREESKITIKYEIFYKGNLVDQESQTVDIDSQPNLTDSKKDDCKFSKETIEYKDEEIPCHVIEMDNIKIWTSEKIPVYGQVKITYNGVPTLELIDWGKPKQQ